MLAASTMMTAQVADAQPRWGRPTAPRSGACFYRDPGFRGAYFCANAGENIAFLSRGMNNQISSIRTFGDTEVLIFQEPRYTGRWTRLEDDVRNLRSEGWNDRLSSIRVRTGDWRDRAEYGGRYGDRRQGSGLGRIETSPWQDDRYDRRDGSGYDPNGRRSDTGVDRYPTDRRDGSGTGQYDPQNRRDGSGVVRTEPVDPRNGSPQQNAEALVARAYRAVLGREPDPASRVYVDKVLRERWTEADVSRELRNSPEYRSKHQ